MNRIKFNEKRERRVFLGLTIDKEIKVMLDKLARKHKQSVSQIVNILLNDFRLNYLKKQLKEIEKNE